MRKWFLSGILLVLFSLLIAFLTDYMEILVYFNEVLGMLFLAFAFYILIGLVWFKRFNGFRNNHDHADYKGKSRLMYKFILFSLPNLIVGEIINRTFDIWV